MKNEIKYLKKHGDDLNFHKVEKVDDFYIPLIKYNDESQWSACGTYTNLEQAKSSLQSYVDIANDFMVISFSLDKK